MTGHPDSSGLGTTAAWKARQITSYLREQFPPYLKWLEEPALSLLGVTEAEKRLKKYEGLTGAAFIRAVQEELELAYGVENLAVTEAVRSGPLIVVANHHLGGVEALLLLDVLLKTRNDVMVFANRFLSLITPVHELLIPVHTLSSGVPNRTARNVASEHLSKGGCLLIFPAARVANWSFGRGLVDPPWRRGAGVLALRSHATVLPAAVDGANSFAFYLLRAINLRLSTLFLLRQLIRAKGKYFTVHFGEPVGYGELKNKNAEQIMSYLRYRTYRLIS